MSFYKYARNQWRKPGQKMKKIWRQRLKRWRNQERIKRIDNPTRISAARSLGYKAKPGVVLVRGRIRRGGRNRRKIRGGRRPKRAGLNRFSPGKSHMRIMEERVNRKYPNLEVLNSYPVGRDAMHKWFEHILIDPEHPAIKKDDFYGEVSGDSGRAYRGKTSAGKSSRGLKNKGKGAEKSRPSKRSNDRRTN